MKHIVNGVCVTLAFISLFIGSIGIVVPILPSTPFFILALALFAKGSKKFHGWFMSTGIYKKYLHDFVSTRSITKSTKIRALTIITLFLGAGIIFSPPFVKAVLLVVLVLHYIYFIFGIKSRGDSI